MKMLKYLVLPTLLAASTSFANSEIASSAQVSNQTCKASFRFIKSGSFSTLNDRLFSEFTQGIAQKGFQIVPQKQADIKMDLFEMRGVHIRYDLLLFAPMAQNQLIYSGGAGGEDVPESKWYTDNDSKSLALTLKDLPTCSEFLAARAKLDNVNRQMIQAPVILSVPVTKYVDKCGIKIEAESNVRDAAEKILIPKGYHSFKAEGSFYQTDGYATSASCMIHQNSEVECGVRVRNNFPLYQTYKFDELSFEKYANDSVAAAQARLSKGNFPEFIVSVPDSFNYNAETTNSTVAFARISNADQITLTARRYNDGSYYGMFQTSDIHEVRLFSNINISSKYDVSVEKVPQSPYRRNLALGKLMEIVKNLPACTSR